MQKKDTGQKAPNTPKAVDDCHQLLLWLIPKIDQFPRQRRFTLGERLETLLMRVLEALVEASYRRDKVDALAEANLRSTLNVSCGHEADPDRCNLSDCFLRVGF